ncbi:MAG: aminopeptidase, partial [Bdellovibrionales bacterium]
MATYIVRSGYDQLSLLNSRTPVEEVIKNPKTPEGIRHKLELSLDVRSFIEKKLKLNVTKNYKTYVQLDRPYVTYIVTVAEKWELKNHLYWYPFVGRMPYKGFFKLENAKEEEATFDKDKYDTMLRGVSAYSTLGWFDDPLLSSMLNGSDYNLVNTLIHESTHASLYIKNNSNFNERLAMFIGNIGTELY